MQKNITLLFLSLLLVCSSAAFAADFQKEQKLPWDRKALIEKLQNGGYVLLIRHERTEVPSRSDDYSKASSDCRAQRNLSVAGASGAQETGVVLRALKIKVGRVISSPMCRCSETARYMFGVNYEIDTRLMHEDSNGERNLEVATKEFTELLKQIAPGLAKTNIALVSHGGTILSTTGLALSEGEVGVIRLDKEGNVTIVDQFLGSNLSFLAREALQQE